MFKPLCVLLICAALLGSTPGLQAQENEFPPDAVDRIQAVLDKAVDQNDLPGVTLLVDSPQGQFAGASGFSNLEAETSMQPDDAFRIGSITKMFTATIMLQLQEEGILTLDDLLSKWLPDIAAGLPYGDQIVLRQLLNHTAGVFNYTDDDQLIEQYIADPYQAVDIQMITDRVIEINEAVFEPGTDWAYSNTNYILAGLVIEAATGSTYDAELRRRILDPVGMAHSFLGDVEDPVAELVHGYTEIDGEQTDVTEWNVQWTWAAGGLVSTPSDMALFIRALFKGDLFAEADSLDQMLDIAPTRDDHYGLGIGKMVVHGWEDSDLVDDMWGHGGGVPGYLSILIYARDADLVVIALQNGESSDPGNVAFDALREALPFLEVVAGS